MSRVNGQVEVDRERMVWELIGRLECGGCSRSVVIRWTVCAGSWSQHRCEWLGGCWGQPGRSSVEETGGEEGRNEV